nr:immunoglobulin heavy chain junction region [Macaca mulatta]MOX37919.1 immunoglobulin heavy chain junction region [Macaca mulatta]MOX37976.1 immunoglobulin heavy chain junction region [Macaca mulatta]MOX38013.1 immunoglobulin heavy chain junction region [Macaca mulatta]MOX38065.1 immunoglobulin heavy chain junction region [Macaca mulatta]
CARGYLYGLDSW